MIRPILKCGDPALHRPATIVESGPNDIQTLIDDMIETMYAASGIGLAAPQVGISLRVFVVDISFGQSSTDLIVMINPSFELQHDTQMEEEGCLSLPGFSARVTRPSHVVVEGLDRNRQPQQVEGRDLLARAMQHEIDHLDGTLFTDRLRGIKRDLIVRRISKLRRKGQW